jgi:uncharacterized membrane protein YgdD (TMEM256/DUF423 family)
MTNRTLQKKFFRMACILLGTAVVLGAFGAHGIKRVASEADVEAFKTGVLYQFIHALGILVISLSLRRFDEEVAKRVGYLFLTGIILFSGSLYIMVITHIAGQKGLGAIGVVTPVGGLCFIAGWFYMAYKAYKAPERND